MPGLQLIFAAIVATTAMSLFSYGAAYITNNHYFKEPRNLGVLVQRLFPRLRAGVAALTGWLLHYGVGFLFVSVYMLLWNYTIIQPVWTNGLWLGLVSGLAGVVIWHLTLTLHPNPVVLNRRRYYRHLLPAHVVFGLFAVIGYNLVPQ